MTRGLAEASPKMKLRAEIRSEFSGEAQGEHVSRVVPRESQYRRGVEAFGRSDVPAGAGPCVVVADVICFEDEVIADAMREIGLIHLTASIGLGRNDVIFGIREVKPVLGPVVDLEADLRASVIFRDTVTNTEIIHLAVMVHRVFKGIASKAAEGSGLTVWPQAVPVGAGEQVELAKFLLQDDSV